MRGGAAHGYRLEKPRVEDQSRAKAMPGPRPWKWSTAAWRESIYRDHDDGICATRMAKRLARKRGMTWRKLLKKLLVAAVLERCLEIGLTSRDSASPWGTERGFFVTFRDKLSLTNTNSWQLMEKTQSPANPDKHVDSRVFFVKTKTRSRRGSNPQPPP